MTGRRILGVSVVLAAGAAVPALSVSGCSGNTSEPAPKVGLMLAVQSDMAIPKDIARMYIEVTENGVLKHALEYALGAPPDQPLPGTLALIPGHDPTIPVKIRVVARKTDGTAVVMREAITTVPDDRVALLPLSLRWLCWGGVNETTTDPSSPKFENATCAPGETCVSGACKKQDVPSKSLPTFEPELVFGGAKLPGAGGICFDTIGCFSGGSAASVDMASCSVDPPSGPANQVNVALVLPTGNPHGICSNGVCLVPLDRDDDEGWKLDPGTGRVLLPPSICPRLGQDISGVAVSTSCTTKTYSAPVCGPWSAVTGNPGSFDASLPFDANLPGDAGTDASSDGGGDSASDVSQDGPPPNTKIGQSCTGDADCGAGLSCLNAQNKPTNEWPAGGVCSKPCLDSSECQALNPNTHCAPLGGAGGPLYCLEACTPASGGSLDAGLDPSKCHGRSDVTCATLVLDDAGSFIDLCAPTCNSDAECSGFCDPATGLCTTSASTGLPTGTLCVPGQPGCSGSCNVIAASGGTGSVAACTSACTIGVPGTCNTKVGGQAATAPMGCLKDGLPNITDLGDMGSCVQLCDTISNCCPAGLDCRPITDPAQQAFYTTTGLGSPFGYCTMPDADAGALTCG